MQTQQADQRSAQARFTSDHHSDNELDQEAMHAYVALVSDKLLIVLFLVQRRQLLDQVLLNQNYVERGLLGYRVAEGLNDCNGH